MADSAVTTHGATLPSAPSDSWSLTYIPASIKINGAAPITQRALLANRNEARIYKVENKQTVVERTAGPITSLEKLSGGWTMLNFSGEGGEEQWLVKRGGGCSCGVNRLLRQLSLRSEGMLA